MHASSNLVCNLSMHTFLVAPSICEAIFILCECAFLMALFLIYVVNQKQSPVQKTGPCSESLLYFIECRLC